MFPNTFSGNSVSTWSFKVTHSFSLVDALMKEYLEPVLEPEATIPPEKGVITPATA